MDSRLQISGMTEKGHCGDDKEGEIATSLPLLAMTDKLDKSSKYISRASSATTITSLHEWSNYNGKFLYN